MLKTKNYIVSFLATIKGDRMVVSRFKNMERQIKQTGKAPIAGKRHTNDFVKALKRAAIVAPVWLALRAVMMKVISTIKEGMTYWMEFDKSIQKSRQVIHGSVGNIEDTITSLTEKIKKLSIETGQSMAKLSSAFYRFGTVGLDVQTAMQGMEVSTKLATIMFGNTDEIARVLAQAYRLLGDSIDQTIPKQEQLAVTGAQIYKLWQTNAFEINEFSGALQQFLPVAHTFNFSMNETLSLLATLQTAGLKSTKAGRLLRTSISKLVDNLDEVALTLGIHVNPELDNTYSVLMRVITAVKKLATTGGELPTESLEAMKIFGGVRSRQAALALASLYDTQLKNKEDVNTAEGRYLELLSEQEAANKKVLKSVHKQMEKYHNLNKLLGQSFVKWVTGSDNFADSLETINVIIKGLTHPIQEITKNLDIFFKGEENWIDEQIAKMETLESLEKTISDMKYSPEYARYMRPEDTMLPKDEDKPIKTWKVDRATEYRLSILRKEVEYTRLQNEGVNKYIIAQSKLNEYIEGRVQLYNTTDKVLAGEEKSLNAQQIITLSLAGEYGKILELTKGTAINNKEIEQIEKRVLSIVTEKEKLYRSIQQKVIDGELKLLKIRGATGKQLVESRIVLEQQSNIKQDELSLMSKHLELEKEITQEKLNQNKASGETVQLWKIGKKYGRPMASKFADILRGDLPFSILYGREERIFKKRFTSRYEQAKAREYYRIESPSTRIQERGIEDGISRLPDITASIGSIKIDVKQILSGKKGDKSLYESVIDAFIKALKDDERIKQVIDEKIENY